MQYSIIDKKITSMPPTKIQQKIIGGRSYPTYLKAGAGSGKTEVLTRKVIDILKNNEVGLENFIIITFTNKATSEMKNRLGNRLYYYWLGHFKTKSTERIFKNKEYIRKQTEICNMIQISTIHSFCEMLLRQYGLSIGIVPNFKIKSVKYELNKIINKNINKYSENKYLVKIPHYTIKSLVEDFLLDNNNKGLDFNHEDVNSIVFNPSNSPEWKEFKKIFCDIYINTYKEIEFYKKNNSILESNDLIRNTVELLQNNYVLKKITAQYEYIFIDEFQDTNNSQFKLVDSLMKAGSNVFLVGDEKQAIYSFRGSDIENSRKISKIVDEFSQEETYLMTDNFRTDYILLQEINEIFRQQYFFEGQALHFETKDLTKIMNLCEQELSEEKPLKFTYNIDLLCLIRSIIENETLKERENMKVLKDVNGNIKKRKIQERDITILFRSNYDLEQYAQLLKNNNIPIEVFGGKGFYRSKEVIDTFKMFNSIIHQGIAYETELKFTDYYAAIKSNDKCIKFTNFMKDLKVIYREESVESILDNIYKRSGIMSYYYSKKNYQAIANLHKLKDIAREQNAEEQLQPIQFLNFLNIKITTQADEDEAEISQEHRNTSGGVISLYSIHKAKGLEFEVVILPQIEKQLNRKLVEPKLIFQENETKGKAKLAFNNKALVGFSQDKDYNLLKQDKIRELLEEELRILYVALTRAKHRLYLFCENPKYINKRGAESWAKWLNTIQEGKFIRDRLLQ